MNLDQLMVIGRSPKEKVYMVPKAVFDLPKKERDEKLSQIFSSWQQKED